MHARCFDKAHIWTQELLFQSLNQPSCFGLGYVDDTPVGFILCNRAADEAEILTLAVLPERRRQNIASLLIREAAGKLSKQNVSKIFLEVAIDNHHGIALYKKFGFTQQGLRKNYYRNENDSIDALVMSALTIDIKRS